MNNNYLKYNDLGILKDSQLQAISQGNHNVDYYYIAYDSYDYTDGFVTVSCTLPDGTAFPELSTSPKEFEFNGENYKGFLLVIRDTLTSQAGVLSMTFNLKSIKDNTQLCSSRLNVTIHESDVGIEPTITQAQYDQMQEVIRENTIKVDEALEKANDALYHDATIVKINGEAQQTWDATFSQELYEESANEFNKNDLHYLYAYLDNNTGKITANDVNKTLFVSCEPNATYTISKVKSATFAVAYCNDIPNIDTTIYGYKTQDGEKEGRVYSTITTGNNAKYILVRYTQTAQDPSSSGVTEKEILDSLQIEKNSVMTSYKKYNQNRHITNSEAEFLREEHNKTINEFDKNNLNLIGYGYIGASSKMIIYTADVPVYYVECKPNVTYTISKKEGKYFRVATFDKIPEIDKTVGLQAIADDEGTSITITTDNNAKYLVFNIYNSTNDTISLQQMLDSVQIEKGNVATPYQPYNSASHITNAQADFLKSSYDKQSNVFPIPDIEETTKNGITYSIKDGVITLNGTCTAEFSVYETYELLTNDAGAMRIFHNKDNFPARVLTTTYNGDWGNYIYINDYQNADGFIFNKQRNHIAIVCQQGLVADNLKLMPMITNIPVIPSEFYSWNGKYITEKDIKPVLLWKNGNPGVEFAAQSISTISNSSFNKIIAIYKSYIGDDNGIIMEFERKTGFVSTINIYQNASSQEVQTRRFKVLNDTTIQIEDCYKNKSVSNVNIIPLAFYGNNY